MSTGNAGLFPEGEQHSNGSRKRRLTPAKVYTVPASALAPKERNFIMRKQGADTKQAAHPSIDLLAQELDEFRTAWEADMEPPGLQVQSPTSTLPDDGPVSGDFGAEYRALVDNAYEASIENEADVNDEGSSELQATQKEPGEKGLDGTTGALSQVARMSAFA